MCVCPGVQTSSSKKQIIIMRLLRSRTLPAKGIFPPISLSNSKLDRHEKEAGAAERFWLVLTQMCVKTQSHSPRGSPEETVGGLEGVNVTLSFGLRLRRAELVQFSKAFHEKTGWNRMSGSMDGHPVRVSCHAELSSITVRTWIHETTLIVKVS